MPTGPKPRPPAGAIRFALTGNLGGITTWAMIHWLNTTNFADATEPDLVTVLTHVSTKWIDEILPLLATGCTITEIKGVLLTSADTEVVASVALDNAGSDSSGAQPAQVAACLSWPISAYYRGGHPRTYLPGITVGATVPPSKLTSDFITAAEAAGAAWVNYVNALTDPPFEEITLGTFSFASGNEWRVTPVFRPFGLPVVHARLDTQRRRLGKEVV